MVLDELDELDAIKLYYFINSEKMHSKIKKNISRLIQDL